MSKINIDRAQFSTVPSSGDPICVHFNPSSLQLAVTNQMEEDRKDHHQYVKKSSAKLTLDLIFDTTDTGEDVRNTTKKIENLMKPTENQQKKKVPPVALFEWGNFSFQGLIEAYKETIDFFSHDGVPLRASVNLSLSQQEKVFEDTGQGGGSGDEGGVTGGSLASGNPSPSPDAVDVPPGDDQSATDMATTGGDPDAGRDIAAANDEESIRFPSGQMTLDPSVQLGSPVAFASGGAGASLGIGGGISAGAGFGIGAQGGIGIGASAGIAARSGIGFSGGAAAGFSASAGARAGIGIRGGASAGFSAGAKIGASASFGASASASAGLGTGASFKANASAGALFGGSASAGVTASEGAFSGLRVQTRTRRFNLDTSRFIQRSESVTVTTDSGARFSVGGQATFEASTSLSTDVGASASLRTRIKFEEG